ncbi:MAG: RsmB/NOP family class I SAM-dependent RNA methyltransferase [Euryarchaeota archaeon]|nr:RsmB/NOP family class I SAM-dependent RNA methyltransferase [Euryarchaeota archaeon]
MQIFDYKSTDLSKQLAQEYGYDEFLIRRYLTFFGQEETIQLLEANERPLKTSILVNTLRISVDSLKSRLESKGIKLEKIPWIPNGFWVLEAPFSVGATTEYLLGHYYLQEAAAMLPAFVLDPKQNEVVIDMCAAPGGKTIQLAQLMENHGCILALEVDLRRTKALRSNLSRCGVKNAIIFRMSALDLTQLDVQADKILLDAPCTGEGVIRKDPTRKKSRGPPDIEFCSALQTKLIDVAVNCLKEGGILVYSTCSLAPEKNELVIDYVIKKHNLKVLPTEIEVGESALT